MDRRFVCLQTRDSQEHISLSATQLTLPDSTKLNSGVGGRCVNEAHWKLFIWSRY